MFDTNSHNETTITGSPFENERFEQLRKTQQKLEKQIEAIPNLFEELKSERRYPIDSNDTMSNAYYSVRHWLWDIFRGMKVSEFLEKQVLITTELQALKLILIWKLEEVNRELQGLPVQATAPRDTATIISEQIARIV